MFSTLSDAWSNENKEHLDFLDKLNTHQPQTEPQTHEDVYMSSKISSGFSDMSIDSDDSMNADSDEMYADIMKNMSKCKSCKDKIFQKYDIQTNNKEDKKNNQLINDIVGTLFSNVNKEIIYVIILGIFVLLILDVFVNIGKNIKS